ncbi:MAG: ATP-binding protein [Symploca sp. SIO2B6]|nr:ATP-binding protein [Symploca sp. SIO2B6]
MNFGQLPHCPFVAAGRIEDPQFFVGRREELDFITSRMTAVQPTSINVVGERRIGKSSLLYHFFQTYEQRVQRYGKNANDYVVIYLSLQQVQCQQVNSFYQAVAKELLKQHSVQKNSNLTNSLKVKPLDGKAFSEAIELWKQEKVLPVLCLDKFEELFDYPQQFDWGFYDNLRSLIDRNCLMVVAASRKKLSIYSKQHKLTSDFFNLAHIMPLKGLTEAEALDLVRLPQTNIPSTQAVLTPERQQLALSWGGRHPFLLQLAGRCLWEAQIQNRPDDWAKAQFEQQAPILSPPRFDPHRWWLPLRWLFWSMPLNLGRLAKFIGASLDDFGNWTTGMLILITVILVVLGLWREEVRDFLKLLGGDND